MNQIIISITSTEVLNKILEGNEQVIIDIKNSVLENYKREKIKPIVDENILQSWNFGAYIRKKVREIVAETIKYEEIDKLVQELVNKSISKIINDEIFESEIETKVKELVNKKLTKYKLK